PVASPRDRLGAHDRRHLLSPKTNQFLERSRELLRLHVVGVPLEGCVAPGGVHRILPGPASPTQAREIDVVDAVGFETLPQRVLPVLRVSTRLGNGADIGEPLDAVDPEELDKLLDRAGGMANGVDRIPHGSRFRRLQAAADVEGRRGWYHAGDSSLSTSNPGSRQWLYQPSRTTAHPARPVPQPLHARPSRHAR